MNKDQKQAEVKELQEMLSQAQAVYVAHYRGLTVKSLEELRRELDKVGARFRVAKNTLVKHATEGTEYALINDELTGPSGFVFANEDAAAAAKAICEFAKNNEKLEIRTGVMEGNLLSAADIVAISKLPSREQLLGMFIGVIQGPSRNLVGVLSGVPRTFVQVLRAIEEQKEAA